VIEDGDFVAVYTQLLGTKSDPSKGGLRQVHLFRFDGDKIAEYWDVTQTILPSIPNPANAF
jgi:predicted SnoaL-like aldol condensation-catalyzing enzyme